VVPSLSSFEEWNITVRVETVVHPTEDLEKVRLAILNLFPGVSIEVLSHGDMKKLVGEGPVETLETFRQKLRSQRILDAAREVLSGGANIDGKMVVFKVDKQVATVGRVNLVEEDNTASLGAIVVSISNVQSVEEFLDWLVPRTTGTKGASPNLLGE